MHLAPNHYFSAVEKGASDRRKCLAGLDGSTGLGSCTAPITPLRDHNHARHVTSIFPISFHSFFVFELPLVVN